MSKSNVVKVGDVISVPAAPDMCFFCIVIIVRKLLYLGVLKGLHAPFASINDVIRQELVLAAWTADAEIRFKRWKIVGSKEISGLGLNEPSYIVGFQGEQWVEDADGNRVRRASKGEVAMLAPRTSFSPAAFEHVVLAMNGHGTWQANWDGLLIKGGQAKQN